MHVVHRPGENGRILQKHGPSQAAVNKRWALAERPVALQLLFPGCLNDRKQQRSAADSFQRGEFR